jgi:hypothetical protein
MAAKVFIGWADDDSKDAAVIRRVSAICVEKIAPVII